MSKKKESPEINASSLADIAFLLLIFFRDPPEARQEKAQRGDREGPDWQTVRRSPTFWLVGVCMFLTFIAMHAPVFINAAHFEDVGLDPTYLTNVASIYAVTLFLGKILTGFGGEKLGVTAAMTFCNLASALSSVSLFLVSAAAPGYALAHEILLGCAIPVETVLLPLIVTEMFGERCYAKIMGLFFAMMCVGYAVGDLLTVKTQFYDLLTNYLFDKLGTYRPILLVYAGIMLLITVAEPIVFAYGKRKRAECARETEASQ